MGTDSLYYIMDYYTKIQTLIQLMSINLDII